MCTPRCKPKFIVGGNWKSNGSTASIEALVSGLNAGASGVGCEVVCGAPFVYLRQTMSTLDSSKFAVAAQNCWEKGPGAYTGEVGCEMLKDIGVPWVILGHSERRALCGCEARHRRLPGGARRTRRS